MDRRLENAPGRFFEVLSAYEIDVVDLSGLLKINL